MDENTELFLAKTVLSICWVIYYGMSAVEYVCCGRWVLAAVAISIGLLATLATMRADVIQDWLMRNEARRLRNRRN